MWHISPLGAEYARSVAECHIACWREAYSGIVPDELLAGFSVERGTASCEKMLSEHAVMGALVDEAVVGFGSAIPTDGKEGANLLELQALYVRRAYYGTGVADALIDAVLDPSLPCVLWVFEANPRAQAFYRRHGFIADGAREPDHLAAGTIKLRMRRNGVRT
jgi:2-(1,2-epoxy-1,2-dihydrophenyl)acetyl-CoA isomerase